MKKILYAALLVIVGCSHVHPEPKGYTEGEFWQEQGKRRSVTQKFSGKMYLSYQSEEQKGAGKGQIIASIPAQTRMELRDPFGRLHYLAILSGSKFSVVYPRQKKYFQDSEAGRFYLRRMVGFDRSFPKLISLFMGSIPADMGSRFTSWRWDESKGLYRGTLKDREIEWAVYVNPKHSTIQEVRGNSPFTSFEMEYAQLRRCCGGTSVGGGDNKHILLAHSVSLTEPKSGHRMGVEWRELQWAAKDFPARAFLFNPPKGSTRIQ